MLYTARPGCLFILPSLRLSPLRAGMATTAKRIGCPYTFAAVRKSDAASVASQVNSGSSRPKCP